MAATLDLYKGDCLPIDLSFEQEDGSEYDLSLWSSITVKALWGKCNEAEIETLTTDTDAGTIEGHFTSAQTECFPIGKEVKVYLQRVKDGCLKSYLVARLNVQSHV